MASVIAVKVGGRHGLIYSRPRTATGRDMGTSYDDGKTWPVQKLLEPGMFAYSNLVDLGDGGIGCLYETNGYKQIVFKRFTLEWLLEK